MRINLPERWKRYLEAMPESGMGYQLVDVWMSDGRFFPKAIVYNSEVLELPDRQHDASDYDIDRLAFHQDDATKAG